MNMIKTSPVQCPCGSHLGQFLFRAIVLLALGALVYAQPTSSSPDLRPEAETTGTIKEYTPGTILILDTLAPNEPTQFKLSKSVVYADADGKTLRSAGIDDEPESPCPLHENRRRKRGGQSHAY